MADVVEVTLVDERNAEAVLRFDGDVLEVFGAGGNRREGKSTVASLPSMRFLARQLKVEVDGPDRKGRYSLQLGLEAPWAVGTLPGWNYRSAKDPSAEALEPLLDALRNAGVPIEEG